MATNACAGAATLFGTAQPKQWNPPRRSIVEDTILVVFLVAQCLDGIFTYVGVQTFGLVIEGNPIVATLMTHLGHELGLLSAKVVASGLGILLHVLGIHTAIAVLAGFYVTVAIAPWTMILFF